MGENLVNHCLLRYTEYTTIESLCSTWTQTHSTNHFNYNSIQNVQQLNYKSTNKLSLIACENLINRCLLRHTEYWNIKFINQSTILTANSNRNTNQIGMKCNVPYNNSPSKIKRLSTFMCHRN